MGLFSSPTALRAGLLNLSGFGAGYVYLRRWVLFGVALVVTVGLLVGAALHGAADHPLVWVPVLLVWPIATGVHGLFAGRSHDERAVIEGEQPPGKLAPVLTAAGLVLAVVAGLAGVWQAGEWRLRVADAAHARGECAEAVDIYERVEAGFQLSMSPSLMDRARSGAEACGLLTRAQDEVAAEEYDRAVGTYGEYFAHPASRWEDTDVLMELYELGTSDYAEERWCDAFDQIGVFADLDWSLAPAVAERIDAEAPEAARRCGWAEVDGGDVFLAEDMLDVLTDEYPDHETEDVEELSEAVGAGLIGARMDMATSSGENELTISATGGADGGRAVLEFTNGSPYRMEFLYVGTNGAHGEVVTDGCDHCEEYDSSPAAGTCSQRGGEVMRLELEPGEYRMLLTFDTASTRPLHGTVDLAGGARYDSCFFLVSL
ncbi:DUF1109 domain-containing protein [Nocardiopsis sp. FIRDI 009]|uniref:DUF1109 domain-containing protein n=1 Tax=Nocardiopsis sp. FIRDI 009 TaxID=714197 RepID=UPI000E265F8C|nr:DUF1109 domain-containing protein [Nocardiopsis sp. FIRDI 009]